MKGILNFRRILFLSIAFILFLLPTFGAAEKEKVVYLVPVEQSIEQGLFKFIERAFQEAEQYEADAIFLKINTPGGEIQAANEIGQLIRSEKIPVIAYVENEAFSAGTYIALNADQIIMTPGSAIGSAAPIDLAGNMADKKVQSAWTKKMVSAAEMNQRDSQIAAAMVDPEIEIEGITKKGEILSLDSEMAKRLGYAEAVVPSLEKALEQTGFEGASVISIEPTMGEKVARFVTNPFIMPLLLTLGLVGIAIEFFIPGFGLPGVIGVLSFALYFFGHYIAGFANYLHIILFVVGILLLFVEVVIPGFGIFGGLGIVSILSGIVMAAYDTSIGWLSLGIAVIVTIVVMIFVVKYFGHRGVWNKFILKDQQKNEEGYRAANVQIDLAGKIGETITPLRPAGTVEIEGNLVDVVTEGGFVEKGKPVIVLRVEGSRVVVREKK